MKKLFALLLSSLFILSSCGGSSSSTSTNPPFEEDDQGLAFYPLDDGTYGVGIGNSNYLSVVTIPSTHNGRSVTKIVDNGFYNAGTVININTINIPNTITSIGDYGFYNNSIIKFNYQGTFEQFNNIEFGDTWLSWWTYNKIQFSFSDKSIKFADLFTSIDVSLKYRPDFSYFGSYFDKDAVEEITPDENKSVKIYKKYYNCSRLYGIYASSSTDYFGGFQIDNEISLTSASSTLYSYESSNDDVIEIVESPSAYEDDINSYFFHVKNAGQSVLNIKLFDMSYPLTINVSNEDLQLPDYHYVDQSIKYDGNVHHLISTGELASGTKLAYAVTGGGKTKTSYEEPIFIDKGFYEISVYCFKNGYETVNPRCSILISNTTIDEYMTSLKQNSIDKHLYLHFLYEQNLSFVLYDHPNNIHGVSFALSGQLQIFGGYAYDIDLSKAYTDQNGNETTLDFDEIAIQWSYYTYRFVKASYALDLGDGKTAYHVFVPNIHTPSSLSKTPSLASYEPNLDI